MPASPADETRSSVTVGFVEAVPRRARHEKALQVAVLDEDDALRRDPFVVDRVVTEQRRAVVSGESRIVHHREAARQDALAELARERALELVVALRRRRATQGFPEHLVRQLRGCLALEQHGPAVVLHDGRAPERRQLAPDAPRLGHRAVHGERPVLVGGEERGPLEGHTVVGLALAGDFHPRHARRLHDEAAVARHEPPPGGGVEHVHAALLDLGEAPEDRRGALREIDQIAFRGRRFVLHDELRRFLLGEARHLVPRGDLRLLGSALALEGLDGALVGRVRREPELPAQRDDVVVERRGARREQLGILHEIAALAWSSHEVRVVRDPCADAELDLHEPLA